MAAPPRAVALLVGDQSDEDSKKRTGQRRRTALAAVVVRRPRLWLLDEPHAGLDQGGRDLIDQLIVDAAGAGATVMLASHELDRTVDLATRHLTVAGGTITADRRDTSDPGGHDAA